MALALQHFYSPLQKRGSKEALCLGHHQPSPTQPVRLQAMRRRRYDHQTSAQALCKVPEVPHDGACRPLSGSFRPPSLRIRVTCRERKEERKARGERQTTDSTPPPPPFTLSHPPSSSAPSLPSMIGSVVSLARQR